MSRRLVAQKVPLAWSMILIETDNPARPVTRLTIVTEHAVHLRLCASTGEASFQCQGDHGDGIALQTIDCKIGQRLDSCRSNTPYMAWRQGSPESKQETPVLTGTSLGQRVEALYLRTYSSRCPLREFVRTGYPTPAADE